MPSKFVHKMAFSKWNNFMFGGIFFNAIVKLLLVILTGCNMAEMFKDVQRESQSI